MEAENFCLFHLLLCYILKVELNNVILLILLLKNVSHKP